MSCANADGDCSRRALLRTRATIAKVVGQLKMVAPVVEATSHYPSDGPKLRGWLEEMASDLEKEL